MINFFWIVIFILVHLVLDWLNLPTLRDSELERIDREYDQSSPWTENDINEKRTTPSEFKKPPTPLPAATQAQRLSTQIAFHEKRKEIQTQRHTDQYSTPLTNKPPVFNNKLSPIDKMAPTTRINTQILVPIKENSSFDDDKQSQIKRRKFDDDISKLNPNKDEVCLSTVADIQEDDLEF